MPTMVLALTALSVVTKSGLASIYNPGAHGFTRGAVRLHVPGEQQRQRVRRLRRDELLRRARRVAMLPRPLRADARRARTRRARSPGRRPSPASVGTFRTDGPTFAVLLVGRHPAHRGPDDLPRAHARAARRGVVALMLRDLKASVIALVVRDARLRSRASRRSMTGLRPARVREQGDGSLVKVERQGRRLAARSSGVHEAAVLPRAAVGDCSRVQRRRDDVRQPRADEPGPARRTSAAQVKAILKLERPYNPGLTVHDIPVDAVTTSGSGIDPDISPAYAALQSRRIAAVRHLPLDDGPGR